MGAPDYNDDLVFQPKPKDLTPIAACLILNEIEGVTEAQVINGKFIQYKFLGVINSYNLETKVLSAEEGDYILEMDVISNTALVEAYKNLRLKKKSINN